MVRWLRVCVLAACGVLAAGPAPAQTSPAQTPPGMSGIYVLGSCAAAEEAWIVLAGIEVTIGKDSFFVEAEKTRQPPTPTGWSRVTDGRDHYFLRAVADGGIDYALAAEPSKETRRAIAAGTVYPPADAVNGPTWQIFQYKPCTALPPDMRVLHGEAVTLLRAFDPAVALCRAGSEACLEALFKAADKNPDGKLNTAEWSRVLRLAAYLSVGVSDDANEGEVAGALAVGLPLAPVIAASIVASYDYDGDGGTSLDEIAGERFGSGWSAGGRLGADAQRLFGDAALKLKALAPLLNQQ